MERAGCSDATPRSGTVPKAYRLLLVVLIIASYELFVLAMPRQQAVTIDSVMVVLAAGPVWINRWTTGGQLASDWG
jgi:hypothetical protein